MSCNLYNKFKNSIHYIKKAICNDKSGYEERVHNLEEQVRDLIKHCNSEKDNSNATVNIEQLFVDKILIDRLEYNNNFGSLGIKELSGMLNIGANYTSGNMPDTVTNQEKNSSDPSAKKTKNNQGPKYNVNYKGTKLSEWSKKDSKT